MNFTVTLRRLAPLAVFALASLACSLLLFGDRVQLSGAASSAGKGPDLTALPLGDGKTTTTSPRRGYLYLCRPQTGGPGAQADGPWIHGGTYDLTAKYAVDGSVDWPAATFRAKLKKRRLRLSGNGLPEHNTGTFPIQPSDDAYQVDRNPNSIRAQTLALALNGKPKRGKPQCTGGQVGVMKSGAALFNAVDAQGKDAVAHEVQDTCSGHPQMSGVYHYHGLPACVGFGSKKKHSKVIGWALDGFPIYGPYGDGGNYLSNAELDVCHGITEKVKYRGKVTKQFHYVANYEFPYTVGCYRGTPLQLGQ
jgi:hypothetical protein